MKKLTILIAILFMTLSSRIVFGTELEFFKEIETHGAHDWESFEINGANYLAVANFWSQWNPNIDSVIYEWKGSDNFLENPIPTHGARDWEYFTIDGEHYLAVANETNGSTHNIDSIIYRWRDETFEKFQRIPTKGAFDWEFFEINGEAYLAVANSMDETTKSHITNSVIYKWMKETDCLDCFIETNECVEEIQEIETTGAVDWESFEIDGVTYLAVANFQDSNENIPSEIFKWDEENNIFISWQVLETNGAYDFESFSIDGDVYLAVANDYDFVARTHNIDSIIYKWDKISDQFIYYQGILTKGARDWKYFEVNGKHFLVVANHGESYTSPANWNVSSYIYEWDGSYFNPIDEIEISTNGAIDWEALEIDGQTYLAVANAYDGTSYDINSKIYKFGNPILNVAMDIKPGSCPNPINTKSKGVISVAVCGDYEFDVTDIDTASIRLEGIAPLRSNIEDVATPFEPYTGKEYSDDCNEYGPDGFDDLVLKFDTQEIVEAIGEIKDGDVLVLTVSGELTDGTQIKGEDVVVIKKKGKK
jgi:EPTP domain